MAELKGTFYGVSVGPGNPELMTLQAVRLIRQCPVLAAPQTASGQMLALDIARSALGEALDGKTIVPLYFAMSRDPAALAASHEKAAAAVRQYLDAGQECRFVRSGSVHSDVIRQSSCHHMLLSRRCFLLKDLIRLQDQSRNSDCLKQNHYSDYTLFCFPSGKMTEVWSHSESHYLPNS